MAVRTACSQEETFEHSFHNIDFPVKRRDHHGRRQGVPLYDLARTLEPMGYGDWLLQAYTPEGTKSLRGLVKVMAGLTVTERDKKGLRLEKYRPFPAHGRVTERVPAKTGA